MTALTWEESNSLQMAQDFILAVKDIMGESWDRDDEEFLEDLLRDLCMEARRKKGNRWNVISDYIESINTNIHDNKTTAIDENCVIFKMQSWGARFGRILYPKNLVTE